MVASSRLFKAQLAILAASPAYESAGVASYEDAAKYAADCLSEFWRFWMQWILTDGSGSVTNHL